MTDAPDTGGSLRVALLGTGTMGAGMARTIAGAGLDLTVWNRNREKAEPLSDVATVVDTTVEAVRAADVVVTMLYDADSVAQAMEGLDGAWAEGAVLLQTTTVGVAGAERLGRLAERAGIGYVDAPVLGTKKPAADGALVVLASGEESLRERVTPVLDAIGSRTMWVGEAGAGSRLKLACNAWVATVVEGVAESLAMTRELGLDPQLFLEAVAGGALDAPYVQLKGKAMLQGQHDPSFALSNALKDVGLMLEATADTDFRPRLLPAIREQWSAAVDEGYGDRDLSATYEAL